MAAELIKKYPYVFSINLSKGGIPKLPVDQVMVRKQGLVNDGHNHQKHYRLIQAVSLQNIETLLELRGEGYPLYSGTTGENITVCHLNVNELPLGTILQFNEGLVIELTKVREPCYVLDEIDPQLKHAIKGRCGMYAKVIQEGVVTVGEEVKIAKPVQPCV